MGGISSRQLDDCVDRAIRIKELERENEVLKRDNANLRKELSRRQSVSRSEPTEQKSEISAARIEMAVDQLLANPETNLSYVPDFIEKPMERNALLYLFNALATTVDSTHIQFEGMGHELVMRLRPIKCEEEPKNAKGLEEPPHQYSDYDKEEYSSSVDKGKGEYDVNAIPM